MDRRLVRLSKFLSYLLRHHPEAMGLELDDAGWVSVEDLVSAARRQGRPISQADILEMLEQSEKKRFTLSKNGEFIRASYGHSSRSI